MLWALLAMLIAGPAFLRVGVCLADEGKTEGDAEAEGKEEEEYRTVVKGEREKDVEEVPHEVLKTEEILKIPGTGGDLLRSVLNLPGTARPPGGSGMLVIRGSAPEDSIVLLEGHRLPILYHFGAFASVINTELIEEIQYIPGNFPVRYGRGTGGLINVTAKLDIPEKWSGTLDIASIHAGLFLKGRVTSKAMVAASVRRSYVEAFIEYMLPEDLRIGIISAPVYYDYQLMSLYKPSEMDELRFIIVGGDDRTELLFEDPSEGDPALVGPFGATISFHLLQVHWKHLFRGGILYHASVQAAYEGGRGDVGTSVNFNVRNFILSHYQHLKIPVGDRLELRAGIDIYPAYRKFRAILPARGPKGFETLADAELIEIDRGQWVQAHAFFLEAKLIPLRRLTLTSGIRLDYLGLVEDFELQPRVMAMFEVDPKTFLTAGVGLYAQDKQPWEVGNLPLRAPRAIHYSAGVERKFPAAWLSTSVQFFWKSFDRLVILSDKFIQGPDGEWTPERYSNRGRGRSYGLELLLKIDPGHRIKGWLAYTLSKSERWDEDKVPYPFDFDQPHMLTCILQGELGRGWELGIRFRYSSGNPYQKVVDALFNADYDVYMPVQERRPSARLPGFHQLDIRLDKKFTFRYLWFAFYIDVTNVYYAKNPEGVIYNYDFTESEYIHGLPIIPSLGLRGGF